METRIPRLTELVRSARKAGAAGVELLYEEWTGHTLQVERSTIVAQDEPRGEQLTVRAWLDGGREGVAFGTLDSGEDLIRQALLAAADEPESVLNGPVDRLAAVQGGQGIDDRRFGSIEHEDRLDVLLTAERAAKGVDRRLVPGAMWYEDRRRQRSFANTKGVQLEERDTVYRAGGSVAVAGETTPIRTRIEARTFASIASLPFGTVAGNIAVSVLKRGDQLQGPVRVLFAPEAVAALFAKLGEGFTAARISSGSFFLQPSEDGSPVVDSRLHLLDDGTVHGGLRTASFDDRGVAPTPLTLLREGRVDGRFIALDAARLTDTNPTGHQVEGKLQPRNLALRSGGRSVNVLLNESEVPILFVHQLPDLDGLDLKTGQMAVPVAGVVYKGAEEVGGMSGCTLSGSLLEVLNSVVEVASNTDRIEHVDAPAMLVDGFSVS